MVRSSKARVGILLAAVGIFAAFGESRPVAVFGKGLSIVPADDPPVSGVYKANGKEAKLAYVSTKKGEPFGDKPTIVMVLTEKDHSKGKKPDFDAVFGKYGSALIITIYEDGQIVGCEVAHTALKHGFSSVGIIKMSDFTLKDGKMQGKLSTGGEHEFFGDKWEVDIKFQAPAP